MNLDKINRWLTLVANLGVLIGIIFLAREIDQSNRIAERDGRSDLISQELDFQRSFIEDPMITAMLLKLSRPNPDLTPTEVFQAETIAQQLQLRIANLTISYETGFLDGIALERQTRGILTTIRRIPGIAPYLIKLFQDTRTLEEGMVSPILVRFDEELRKYE